MPDSFSCENGSVEEALAEVVDAFRESVRCGERPDVEEYARRHPQLADILRRVLPALDVLRPEEESVPPLPVSVQDLPGTLGDYRLVREVGKGGMGVVYEAEQISLGRRVALKVLPFAATMDARQLQRFHNEARAAASLHHEHIAPVYAVGCERGVHFYAMQFIDGQTLAQRIAELRGEAEEAQTAAKAASPVGSVAPAGEATEDYRPSPVAPAPETVQVGATSTQLPALDGGYFRRIAEWGIEAAEALEYAHSVGVVHRDIKPGNLMVDAQSKLWVTDFGLARTAADSGLTMTGDLVGTLRYMSPEQALAKHDLVDHRTDVYSLSVTLYELLTLHPAVDGKDRQEILQRIAFEEPMRPRRLERTFPAELEIILLKAMEKRPQDRYATAQELADDLRYFLEEKPIRARRATLVQRAMKWGRRHRSMMWAAGLALLVTAVALTVSTLMTSTAYRAEASSRRAAEEIGRREAKQRHIAERERDIAEHLWYGTDMQLGQQAWETANIKRLTHLLDTHRPGPNQRDLRCWEWQYLRTLCHRDLFTLLCSPRGDAVSHEIPHTMAWSPDGRRLAAPVVAGEDEVNEEGGAIRTKVALPARMIKVWDATTGKELLSLRGHTARIMSLSWSPDSKQLASSSGDGKIKVWSMDRGDELLSLQGHARISSWLEISSLLAWSPDGKRLASAGNDGTVKVWQVTQAKALLTLRHEQGHRILYSLAWSPDGKRLALAGHGNSSHVTVWDSVSGQQVFSVPFSPGYAAVIWHDRQTVAWRQDGKYLAAVWKGGMVKVLDAATGQEVASLRSDVQLYSVAWSPDNKHLAATAFDNTVKVWHVERRWQQLNLCGHKGTPIWVAWSPDGRRLASAGADRMVKLWDADTGRELLSLRGHSDKVREVVWGPEGQRLASRSSDGTIKVWDTIHEQEATNVIGPYSSGWITWRPDGRLLAWPDKSGNYIRMFDPLVGREQRSFSNLVNCGGSGKNIPVRCSSALNWSPDGKWLAAAGGYLGQTSGFSVIWDAATGQELSVLGDPTERSIVKSMAWSPDSKRIVVAGGGHLRRPSKRPQLLDRHMAAPDRLNSIGEPRSGVDLFVSLKIWDVVSGREILNLRGHTDTVLSVAWSSDGRRLASASNDQTIKIWDTETGQELLSLPGSRIGNDYSAGKQWIACSPNSPRLASVTQDHTIKIWDETTGEKLLTLRGHTDSINAVAWHPDGQRLVSGGHDRTVKVWDSTTGQELLNLSGPASGVGAVGWSPDGQRLAARYYDGIVRVWDTAKHVSGGSALAAWKNDRAWQMSKNLEVSSRNPGKAVTLARDAVDIDPLSGNYWNTLGVAHYRTGDWHSAIQSLEHAMKLRQGDDSCDLFFLAMSHWQLGEKEQARKWYAKAVQWMDKNAPQDEDLLRFRVEAATLLGIAELTPAKESPTNKP